MDHAHDDGLEVLLAEHLVALLVNDLPLLVDHVVVFQEMLADVEVVALHPGLSVPDRLGDQIVLDGDVFLHPRPLHEALDPLPAEAAHQVILQGDVEAGGTGIALTPGAPPQLVVNTPRFVALGTQDVETTQFQHLFAVLFADLFCPGQSLGPLLLRDRGQIHSLATQVLPRQALRIAPQLDVHAAASHVSGNGHSAGAASLGDEKRLLLVILGVKHLVGDTLASEQFREHLRPLDEDRAHQHRSSLLMQFFDLSHHGPEFGLFTLVDQIRVINALVVQLVVAGILIGYHLHTVSPLFLSDQLPLQSPILDVGGQHDHIQAVDLVQLFSLGDRCSRHACQLLVHAEVVLQGDGSQSEILTLHLHPLFGLDGLVQPLRIAPPVHQAAGELVNDDHLPVFDDVVAVAMEDGLSSQGIVHVGSQGEVLRGVEVVHPQPPLHPLDSVFSEGDHPILLVHDVIHLAPQAGDEVGHAAVVGIRLLSRAGDDERRARLVYQNVVHLVYDGVVEVPLHLLGEVHYHVVPQVVEAKFVVGAVGDVGLVSFTAAHGPQVLIAFIVGQVLRIEEEGRPVLDNPHREAQKAIDGAHPLGVALGQVVVDGNQVTPLAR